MKEWVERLSIQDCTVGVRNQRVKFKPIKRIKRLSRQGTTIREANSTTWGLHLVAALGERIKSELPF